MEISCYPAKYSLINALQSPLKPPKCHFQPFSDRFDRFWASGTVVGRPLCGRRAVSGPNPAGDATGQHLRPRTSDFGPRLFPAPLRATFRSENAFRGRFQSKTPRGSPLIRDRHYMAPQNRHKPISRALPFRPLSPYSPNPQPVAPLTRPRISAIL